MKQLTIALFASLIFAGCAGQSGSVPPVAVATATPSPAPPIVITPGNSCDIGGITISGPAVVGCGATPSPTPQPTATVQQQANEANELPIPNDPYPPATNPATFATCVPVFNDLVSGWAQVGCASTALLLSHAWVINNNTGINCTIRYDTTTNDVILFFCEGNPYA
jgi:hypothetical protein